MNKEHGMMNEEGGKCSMVNSQRSMNKEESGGFCIFRRLPFSLGSQAVALRIFLMIDGCWEEQQWLKEEAVRK